MKELCFVYAALRLCAIWSSSGSFKGRTALFRPLLLQEPTSPHGRFRIAPWVYYANISLPAGKLGVSKVLALQGGEYNVRSI